MMILAFRGAYWRFEDPDRVLWVRGLDRAARTLAEWCAQPPSGRGWLGGWLTFPGRGRKVELYAESHLHDPIPDPGPDGAEDGGPWLAPLRPVWDLERYRRAFDGCRRALRLGESYQINLTFPLRTRLLEFHSRTGRSRTAHRPISEQLRKLWRAVGAQSGRAHAALIVPQPGGPARALVSWSPELWIRGERRNGGWELESRPMKGTAPHRSDPEQDRAEAYALASGTKTRAENLMITDMVRNEFSQLVWGSRGTVETPHLFEVESLTTLWQMTSTVRAWARLDVHPFADIVRWLFPPASVTGAPKRRTLEWIHRLEGVDRGLYTGVSFLIAPEGAFESSVNIRSLEVDTRSGRAVFGVGGGVVFDSTPEGEYREAKSKAAFLGGRTADFDLVETLRWEPCLGPLRWDRHARRVQASARAMRRTCDLRRAWALIRAVCRGCTVPQRLRLSLDPQGRWTVEHSDYVPLPQPLRLRVASAPMSGPELLRRLKTSRREIYERFGPSVGEETVLWDAEGWVLEGTFTNLAFRIGGRWRTPSARRPLLAGVFREELLEAGRIEEADLRLEEALAAEAVACFNSLRGWMDAVWATDP